LASIRPAFGPLTNSPKTPVKSTRARCSDWLNSTSGNPAAWRPAQSVRLIRDADVANFKFALEHIDQALFQQLVEVDDALVAARRRESVGPSTVGDARVKRLLFGKPSPQKVAALELLRSMSKEQRGEYLALVQVGRGDASGSELAARTAVNIRSRSEDHYLLEKLGNGYMRKALSRFGLVAPATQSDRSPSGPSEGLDN